MHNNGNNGNNDYPINNNDLNDYDLMMSRYDMRRRGFDFDERRDFDFDRRRRDFNFDRRDDEFPSWLFFWPFFFR